MTLASAARAKRPSPTLALCIAPFAIAAVAPLAAFQDAEGDSTSAPVEASAPAGPGFRPAALRPALDDPDVVLPIAVHLASCGDAAAGAAHLSALEADLEEGAMRERVAAERARMETWVETRDRFLARAAERDDKLIVHIGDNRRRLEVARFEDGVVHFEDNRWDVASKAARDIDPIHLARRISKAGREIDAGWIPVWVHAVCGEDHWDRMLDGNSAEIESFREHAQDYAGWLSSGAVHAELLGLSQAVVPADAAAAEALLERIRAAAETHAGDPALEAVRDPLADLAEAATWHALADASIGDLHPGSATDLEDGRVRIDYGFDSDEVFDAFERGTYSRMGEGFDPDPEAASEFRVEGGELILEGNGCLRTLLEFEGPIAVEYTYAILEFSPRTSIAIGMHDDGEGNLIRAESEMMLMWMDVNSDRNPPAASATTGGQVGFMPNMDYDVRVAMDEEGTCTLSRDGDVMADVGDCPRDRGAVFLSVPEAGDGKLVVTDFTVESRVTEDSMVALRRAAATRAADELRSP